ncbi:MAG: TetR/AcrR family transcriptional regulator [Jatrophihabitans sp.]
MIEQPAADRPLRRDAAQNRERVIEAAGQVFAEHGLDAGVDEVARLAGVGMGTLYRRFPTKQALIDELIAGLRQELLELARDAAARSDGTGLEELLLAVGQLQATRSGCLQQLLEQSDADPAGVRQFRDLLAELVESARQHARIRPDVTRGDITMIFWAVSEVIETTRAVAPQAWRRHLELLIAGLRPVGDSRFAHPLQEKPLTAGQVEQVRAAYQSR